MARRSHGSIPNRFQTLVYAAVADIPWGRVASYHALARHLGCRSPQAIGQALGRNPFAPQVPCHRIIRKDLSLGGYAGSTLNAAAAKKRNLLEEEGVLFDAKNRLVDQALIWSWND